MTQIEWPTNCNDLGFAWDDEMDNQIDTIDIGALENWSYS